MRRKQGTQRAWRRHNGERRTHAHLTPTSPSPTQAAGCPVWTPDASPPTCVVHLLGGAFAGAAPAPAYGLLAGLIADGANATVIATPYSVTFKHAEAASSVVTKFDAALAGLRAGSNAWAAPTGAPTHAVGHSMGALLHLLAAAVHAPPHASAVLLSYNNKPVADAVPVSLDGVAGGVRAALDALGGGDGRAPPTATDLLSAGLSALRGAGVTVPAAAASALADVAPAVDQLGSVSAEVGAGAQEFEPTPAQSRTLIEAGYRISRTLLIKFDNDTIDESPDMARLLARAVGGPAVVLETLPGTHVTPCGGDVDWTVGASPTPLDLFALGGRALVQADARRLAARVVGWIDGVGGGVRGALPG